MKARGNPAKEGIQKMAETTSYYQIDRWRSEASHSVEEVIPGVVEKSLWWSGSNMDTQRGTIVRDSQTVSECKEY